MRERSHGSSELEDMRRGRAGCWCGRLVTDLGEFSVRESSIDLEFPHPELSNCHRPFSLFPFFVYLPPFLSLSLSRSLCLSMYVCRARILWECGDPDSHSPGSGKHNSFSRDSPVSSNL